MASVAPAAYIVTTRGSVGHDAAAERYPRHSMGAVTFSIDPTLVQHLKSALPLEAFVETGTFEGDAIATVRPFFDAIDSIELSDHYYSRATQRFASDTAVKLHRGDSANTLRQLRPRLRDRAVLYWLDAHWCVAENTAGECSQSPLLAELKALETLNKNSAVLIDDARLFMATPPDPHEISNWPGLSALLDGLRCLSETHELMVVNDVIVLFPATATEAMTRYARHFGVDLLAERNRLHHLEEENAIMTAALAERLDAINELTRVAEERGTAIDALTARVRELELNAPDRGKRPRA
jgi:hypothetical protein